MANFDSSVTDPLVTLGAANEHMRSPAVVEFQVLQTPAGAEILLRAEGPVDAG